MICIIGCGFRSDPEVSDAGIPRFNNQRTGNARCSGITEQPSVIWKIENNAGYELLYSDGVLLLYGHGSLGGIDAEDGTSLWAYSSENQLVGSPCINNGMVYFSASGLITILDLHSGDLIANVTVPSLSTGPMISDSLIISGLTLGGFIAVRIDNYTTAWHLDLSGLRPMTLSISDSLFFATLKDSPPPGLSGFQRVRRIGAFEITTGKPVWITKLGPVDIDYIPIVSDLALVVLSDSLAALDLYTGDIRWKVAETVESEIGCTYDQIVFCDNREIISLDPYSGMRLASKFLPGGPYHGLIVCDDVIYLGGTYRILCLNHDFEPLWVFNPAGSSYMPVDNKIFFTIGGSVYSVGH